VVNRKAPNIISRISAIFILILVACSATYTGNEQIPGYDLALPRYKFVLPDTLREISGLTSLDSASFACVQDENGILFIYDAVNNKIKRQHAFYTNGDYEGIARVGKSIYVLRSDGMLFEIPDYEHVSNKPDSFATGVPASDNEGLCYDADHNRLLIACKGKTGKGREFKDRRVIYGFDLKMKILSTEPVFEFDVMQIKEFAIRHKISLPAKARKKKGETVREPQIKFMTSAICIHPQTKKLYLLSAADHLLFVFGKEGTLEHMEWLNPALFNKAEGITFFENGDMLITNEGQDKKPTLLRFKYKG